MVRRARALLLLGRAAALRRSEVVGLDLDDLTSEGDPGAGTTGGLLVRIRSSKTDQTRTGAHVAVPWSTHYNACPVRAAMPRIRDRRTPAAQAVSGARDRPPSAQVRLPSRRSARPGDRRVRLETP